MKRTIKLDLESFFCMVKGHFFFTLLRYLNNYPTFLFRLHSPFVPDSILILSLSPSLVHRKAFFFKFCQLRAPTKSKTVLKSRTKSGTFRKIVWWEKGTKSYLPSKKKVILLDELIKIKILNRKIL